MLTSLSQTLISTTGIFLEHMSVTGYYHYDIEGCYGDATAMHAYLWVPCLVFEAILALLSLWISVQHSKQYSRFPRSDKPQLVDVLIQGNVIYFLGCACSVLIEWDLILRYICSPLVTFILYLNSRASLEIHWFADSLFLLAPITLSVGCRLILSVQEAASHHLTLGSHPVMSTFSARNGSREEDSSYVG